MCLALCYRSDLTGILAVLGTHQACGSPRAFALALPSARTFLHLDIHSFRQRFLLVFIQGQVLGQDFPGHPV